MTSSSVASRDDSVWPLQQSISVIVAAHTEDRWDDIVKAVGSALAQQLPPLEVILVIDHNDALADRARAELDQIRVVENTGPPGASAARNTGVAHSSGEIVVFLDDDQSAAAPLWLATLCRHFSDPAVIGVGGGISPAWEGARPRWFPGEFDWVVGTSYVGMPTALAPIRNVWGGNSAIRRSAFDAAGGFRSGFGKTGEVSRPEDTDLCVRVQQAFPSSQWLYDPLAVVTHRVGSERATRRYFLARCWDEGRGKAALLRFVGSDGIQSETRYAAQVLPRAVMRELRLGIVDRHSAGFERCAALVIGFVVTAAGWLVEMAVGARCVR
jgi:GT2 family glycosyltransferase